MTAPQSGVMVWSFGDDAFLDQQRNKFSGWHPENLRKDFSPSTVIDVGVGDGTLGLYDAFPDAYLVLVEPLVEFEEFMQRLLTRHRGEYLLTAAGSDEGSITIEVDLERPTTSAIMPKLHRPRPLEPREIPLTTLDRLCDERRWEGPFGLKIDTEGFEHQVVEGAARLLETTQFVIAEVNVTPRFEGSYAFAEFIALMDAHGFAAFDVLDGFKVSPPGRMVCMDILFRRT